MLPDTIHGGVGEALYERGLGDLHAVEPMSGGCINHGSRIESSTGATYFLKWRTDAPAGMYAAEATGLAALADAVTGAVTAASSPAIRIPRVIAVDAGGSWLLMDFITEGRRQERTDEALGRGLAAIHGRGAGALPGPGAASTFGWHADNWIGTLPQPNPPCRSWSDFWRDARITPQLELARARGAFGLERREARAFDSLLEVVEPALGDVEAPSLVHGDLWSGNAYSDEEGRPVLIDPAVYRGHGEVDLAMTELFGGFGPRFYAAYDDTIGISDAYHAYRRDLYQLYYLLVHVNLFGGSYVDASLRAADRVLAELR